MNFILYDSCSEYTINSLKNSLGGTQSAVLYLAQELEKLNNKVTLVNQTKINQNIENIQHIPMNQFDPNSINIDIFIVLNNPVDILLQKFKITNANVLYVLYIHNDITKFIPEIADNFDQRHILEMTDLFIFVSEWIQHRYEIKFDIPKYKSIILKNGTGNIFENILKNPIPNKKKNSLIYCSSPDRGLEYLIHIFPKIQQKISSASLTIRSGLSLYNKNIKDVLYKNEFDNISNVDYSEPVSQENLSKLLIEHEILAYPSNTAESSCIVILQAMAAGCIIVTSDLGALPETTPSNNFIVPFDDDANIFIANFTKCLEKVCNLSNQEKQNIKDKNRQYVKENYLCEKNVSTFLITIQNIYNSRHNYINNIYPNSLQTLLTHFQKGEFQNFIDVFFNSKIKYYRTVSEYYTVILNLGVSYYFLNHYNYARKYFKTALAIQDDFNVNKNLAKLETDANNDSKSIEYLQKCLKHNFDIGIADMLAVKLHHNNMIDAYEIYQRILYINPYHPTAIVNQYEIDIMLNLDNIDKINACEQIMLKTIMMAHNKNYTYFVNNAVVNYLITDLYLENKTPSEHFQKLKNLMNTLFLENDECKQICLNFNRFYFHTKLRIGYISSDFKVHPVGFMFYNILKNHSNNIDIFCYDLRYKKPEHSDIVHQAMINLNKTQIRYIAEETDENILKTIINDDLDILIEMMGFTNNSKMYLLKYKPARILISYFAYPGSCGIKEIDYKLTDSFATPSNLQEYYTEKLWYLPFGFQTYENTFFNVDAKKRYNRESPYTIHLGYFNNPKKLSPTMIKVYSNILLQMPNAKLFMRYCLFYNCSFYKTFLKQKFLNEGVKEEQVDISHCAKVYEYLDSYNNIDISLDPYPYNGGITSHESLWMNTPFITLEGKTYHSRVGVSLLNHMELQKFIAKNKGEYIQKVINLANNKQELYELHQNLRNNMKKISLGNPKLFTESLENAYFQMVENHKNL